MRRRYIMASFLMIVLLALPGCYVPTGYYLVTAKITHQHCDEACKKRHRMQGEYMMFDPIHGPGYKLKGTQNPKPR